MPRPITRAPVDGKCRACGSTDFGTRNRCKPCRAREARERWARDADYRKTAITRKREWRRANPDKARAEDRRSNYKVLEADFRAMLASQDQRCAICRSPDPNCVDHCHTTGRFRGVLCRTCNAGLGQFRDDPALMRAAALYVEQRRASDEGCLDTESNRGHGDFQSPALPTELSRRVGSEQS